MPKYHPQSIEPKWQAYWDQHDTFLCDPAPRAEGPGKSYVLDMFPYPSGEGLHVGHPEGYTATDIVCRRDRMLGKHVLHPMGWDAFGLPAEQYAMRTGTHPAEKTKENIATFKRQLKSLGFSYDWSRELATTDPDYYRWTQWIFLQLHDTWYDPDFEWTGPDGVARTGKGRLIGELPIPKDISDQGSEAVRRFEDSKRLAYQQSAPVNWCPALGTVLANEEITAEGLSERGGHPVERVQLRQWMLRITAYADRLLEDLEPLDWSDSIKALQRNWIGRSLGAEVDFFVGDARDESFQMKEYELFAKARADHGYPEDPGTFVIRVYTTRPDTLYGATYMVLAPEHPLVEKITTPDRREPVADYQRQAARKSDLDRTDLAKEKTGCFTGAYAVNPVSGLRVPVWIADYVLASYGTGAIMAVPAHDVRDFEFAVQFDLPIKQVVRAGEDHKPSKDEAAAAKLAADAGRELPPELPLAAYGRAVHSGDYDGYETAVVKERIVADLAEKGVAKATANTKLRDWLFSRQHVWGEPFPVWHELDADGNETGLVRVDPADELPVEVPADYDFKAFMKRKQEGTVGYDPPLAASPDGWLYKTAEDGTRLKRETNSMPQWAGSCWYYLRYCDPKNAERFIDPELERYWLPVDLYVGGAEHAVLHLLYARFWHKVLFDRGHVTTPEPFQRLVNQGMILGEPAIHGYQWDAPAGESRWVSAADVRTTEDGDLVATVRGNDVPVTQVPLDEDATEKKKGQLVLKERPTVRVVSKADKMSKSRGNVINPDDVVGEYGADSLRLYEMFMGPLEQTKPWSMSGVEGVSRFLARAWRMVVDDKAEEMALSPAVTDGPATDDQDRVLHKTIRGVSEDLDRLQFNTAISKLMEFTNAATSWKTRPRHAMETFTLLLSPFAPHLSEELWQVLGHTESLAYEPWPVHDPDKIVESEIEIPVQVNGKLRAKIRVPADAGKDDLQKLAESDASVQEQLAGKTVRKAIVVPGRMVNFVAN